MLYKIFATSIGLLTYSKISRQYLLSKVENDKDIILQPDQFPNTTILLPTLNEEWFIENTLKSIKNQNIYKLYPERFEILIVDSESEDNTLQIAERYLSQLDKIIIFPERNLVKARTTGIKESRGDMIVFIDADTIYPINWLNSMLKCYYEDTDIVAVSGPELHPNIDILTDTFEPIVKSLRILKSNPMIGHNSSCYKWAFNLINGFDVPFEYDIKSSKDTQIVLEKNFAKKLQTIGKYIYDNQLTVYDYGLKRRRYFYNRNQICKDEYQSDETKYICKYWEERDNRTRF